jgi:ribA/ribD-fused uncharacterized protein
MIDSFHNEYWFLSNFFYPCRVEYQGAVYPSAENAYQASKTDDPQIRQLFQDTLTNPRIAKDLGSKIVLTDPEGWKTRRIFNMRDVVRAKFLYNVTLQDKLLSTGDHELVEGNTHGDRFWGRVRGDGENWLGRILMLMRADIRHARERLF